MLDFFKGLDPKTAIYTALIIPIVLLIKKILLKHLKEWTEYLWEGLMYFVSEYIKQSLAASLSMKRYCRLQLGSERIKYLNIPSSLDISLEVDRIFVNLTLTYLDEQEKDFSHTDFLTIGNRIKIMGDPGAGKSSLIKKVFRDKCRSGLSKPRKTKLPVLFELKNINFEKFNNDQAGKFLYECLKSEISKNNIYKMEECFESYATSRGLLVLLDGLDEVSTKNYPIAARCINDLSDYLSDLSPNNSVVLTMRTQFYQQIKNDFTRNFPHSTFLKPFTPSDIYDFLSRWHFKKETEKNISRIYKDLTDRPTLREMCSNPLILSIYVAEDQISKGNASPESRTQFYRKITEELIIKRRLAQTPSTTASYTSLKEQRERILGKIAYDHLLSLGEPKNMLSWEKAITIIKEILDCGDSKAELIFNEISKETGLITEERYKESFRFIHLTFCEFLAAFEVVQGMNDGWRQLINHHKNFVNTTIEGKSRLIEVIPFTAGLLPRFYREQALYDIAELNDTTLMSRCFLETKFYSHESWSNFIKTSRDLLLNNIGRDLDEKWLQDLHLFNVVVRDAKLASENMNIDQNIDLSNFYENLLDNDKIILNKILSAYASQDAAAVFRLGEISNINLQRDFPNLIIQNCDQIPFLGLIKDKIIQNKDESENWAALLVESALQKKLVSYILNTMQRDEELNTRIKGNSNYVIWFYKKYIPETFFTQCLTIATKRTLSTRHLKNLNLLSELKSPFEIRYKISLSNWCYYLSFCGFLILMAISVSSFKALSANTWALIGVTVAMGLFEIIAILSMKQRKLLLNFYKIALNLNDPNHGGPEEKSIFTRFPKLLLGQATSSLLLKKKDKAILNSLIRIRG